jgi:5'-phosphate synthase pdxT subunit
LQKHPIIGVLALQGDFEEHCAVFNRLGYVTREIRTASELQGIDGLVIPGGESSAVAILESTLPNIGIENIGMFEAIKKAIRIGLPTWGTCMGSIVLAKKIEGSGQGRIGLMDITVRRNAFGPQKFSSEELLDIPVLGKERFHAVYIRAPLYIKAAKSVDILAKAHGGFVMARQDNMLITCFHPEITDDTRVHEYFLGMIKD